MGLSSADVAARTDRGSRRPGNEDAAGSALHSSGDAVLLLVADGVGGLKDGAYASNLAVEYATEAFLAANGNYIDAVDQALLRANEQIFRRSGGEESRLSGTTIVAIVVEPDRATVSYAGDSRAYRLRNGELEALTRDHSLVNEQVDAGLLSAEEAEFSLQRNVITRCLGVEPEVELEHRDLGAVEPGDVLLLSTDGLHDVLPEPEIASLLAVGGSADQMAADLIDRANASGGPDNIGVTVLCMPRERDM